MMAAINEWTLTDASRLLEVPQHRLIYFCEKGIVEADLQEAEGRGSSRRFSTRNLLEFAVALRLRDMELAAGMVGAVLYVLRAFEKVVAKEIPDFRLPESLRETRAPDLRVIVSDGQRLYFSLRAGQGAAKLFGGVDLAELDTSKAPSRGLSRVLAPVATKPGRRGDFGGPEGSRHVRLEISISQLARDLPLGV